MVECGLECKLQMTHDSISILLYAHLTNSFFTCDSNVSLFDEVVHNQDNLLSKIIYTFCISSKETRYNCHYYTGFRLIQFNHGNHSLGMNHYNKIMFEELVALLTHKDHQQTTEKEVGKIVDLLRQIEYFQNMNSMYGTDYLILLTQTIQPFILREGFGLINQNDHYLILSGQLHEQEPRFGSSRKIEQGRILDLKQKSGVIYIAKSDCKMLRMKKGPSAGFHIQKKLVQLQRDRKRSLSQMQRLLGGQNYKQKFKFLQQIPFFMQLGEYDFLQIVGKSEIKQYSHGSFICKYGEIVNKVGCIIAGKVKLIFSSNQDRVRNVEAFLNEGEWLGLEEFLFNNNFQATGQASSIVAMVVWVPRQIFQQKFNTKTNHSLINRIKGLIQTKRMLFQRGVKCRKTKDIQPQQNDRKCLNAKLMQKISNLQLAKQKHKSNFRRTKINKDMQIPEKIMHRINYNSEFTQFTSLPKLTQKINLFAQEYKTIPVANVYLKQLQRLQKNKNRSLGQKITRTFTERNPEQLFQTILQKLPPKLHKPPRQTCKTFRQQKSTTHYNKSIYNNFRVGKQRVLSLIHPQMQQQIFDFNNK